MLKPRVEVHNSDGVLVAEFWDCLRLDPAPALELRTKYDQHLAARRLPFVLIDLSGVSFAGSSALGNFVALHRTARQNGGRVVFCQVEPTVAEVFRASNLDKLFEFVADREAGLAAIARGEPGASAKKAEEPAGSAPRSPDLLNRLRRKRPASEPE